MQKYSTVGNGFFQVIKGSALALALSFLYTVGLASVSSEFPLSDRLVYTLNQTVKGVCIAVGTLAFARGEKGFLKGVGIALSFTALSYLAFSAFGGDFSLSWLILVETVLASIYKKTTKH